MRTLMKKVPLRLIHIDANHRTVFKAGVKTSLFYENQEDCSSVRQ